MPFFPLNIKPGVIRDTTLYNTEGYWFDCDKVRFRRGEPEKIKGWEKYATSQFIGVARALHDWGTVSGTKYLSVGTHLKLYINIGTSYYDITPIRDTETLGTDPITTTSGSGLVTITDTDHGAVIGDYVTISGASTTNGIPDTDINQEHRVVGIVDDDTFQVVFDTAASSSGAGGGSSVVLEYQINVGLIDYVQASGWGAGAWGSGAWGGTTSIGSNNQLRLWSFDNFGDDLIAGVRLGGVYYWDQSAGTASRAVPIHELTRRSVTLGNNPIATSSGTPTLTITDNGGHGAGVGDLVTISGVPGDIGGIPQAEINATHTVVSVITKTIFTVTVTSNASSSTSGGGSGVSAVYQAGTYFSPSKCLQILVSDQARHILVFGANDIGSQTIDPLLVRWCSSENAAEWQPTTENTAGGQRLSAGSEFIGAIRTKQEILAFTDAGITGIRYTGGDFTFGFHEVASGVSLISPNAAVDVNGVVYFMDRGHFHTYSGHVQDLNCTVHQYVFPRIDFSQAFKIVAGSNEEFSEVIWLYPSVDGNGDIDSYVLYNYDENLWTFGTIARGYWTNAYTKTYPVSSAVRIDYL